VANRFSYLARAASLIMGDNSKINSNSLLPEGQQSWLSNCIADRAISQTPRRGLRGDVTGDQMSSVVQVGIASVRVYVLMCLFCIIDCKWRPQRCGCARLLAVV